MNYTFNIKSHDLSEIVIISVLLCMSTWSVLLTGFAMLGLWICFNTDHWDSLILAGHCQTCSFSMEEATTCLGSAHRPGPVYWLPGPPSQWEPLELCSGSDTVAPLFLWCAGSELVIKAADVSLGRGCIHVYAGWGERQWGLLVRQRSIGSSVGEQESHFSGF